ncbi:MAG: hypothetical protein KUG78_17240 [Kangiellaceae bacterium]|nr:hypothetical protein [Kangiellaceae bacterium]
MKFNNNKIAFNASIIAVLLISTTSHAVRLDYTLYTTYRYSDNLAQSNEQLSGTALNSGGTFNFENEGQGVWSVDFSGAISKEWFSIDELADQDRNQLSASVEYSPTTSNFEFLLRDDYSQAPRDRFAVEEVGNLVDVNVITARPSYFFNITPLDLINTEITYLESTRDGEDSDVFGQESFDFVNISKEIRYEKTINTSSDISLVFDSVTTRFNQDSTGTNFEQENLFVRWIGRGRLNQIQLEFGKARVTNELNENFDTELFNLLYSRQINPRNNIGISLRNSVNFVVSESFIDDSINVDDQVGNFGNAQKVKSANVTYTVTGDALSGNFQFFRATYEGLNGQNSEKRLGGGLSLNYSLSQYLSSAPQSNVNFVFQRNKNSFDTVAGAEIENDVVVYSTQFNYFARESLSFFFQYLKRDASSTSLTSAFLSGDSESVSIGFNYAPPTGR